MKIVITGQRSGKPHGYEWHIENVPYWRWRVRRGSGVIGTPPIWIETWWRFGRLHVKRFVRVENNPSGRLF